MERRKQAQVRNNVRNNVRRQRLEFIGTQLTLAALAAATVAPLALLVSLVPRAQVLPVLCLVALAAAALVACVAWCCGAKRHGDSITSWDVAGALAFIGFAAGMLSETSSILQLFGHEAMRN
jgi:hypothetical protein